MAGKLKNVLTPSVAGRLKARRRNRQLKDRLFKRVFREKKYLLELYNALNGSSYSDEDALEVVTLEDVLYINMKNDMSFIVGNMLNLYEHQSTFNGNIALRVFLYFARQYELIVEKHKKGIYGEKQIKLPYPQCVVFYNGDKQLPDDSVIKMSDAYIKPNNRNTESLVPAVECTVRQININCGHNSALFEKCQRLQEYSRFIQIVRECDACEPDRQKALDIAIDMAEREGLLPDIIVKEKSEVKSMLLTEFDEKKFIRTMREEGWEDGHKTGCRESIEILNSAKSGTISYKDAAKKLGVPEKELANLLKQ